MSWQYITVKYIGRLTLPFYFGHFEINGREHIPRDKPYIIAPNHQNAFIDAIFMGVYNDKHVHFLTRSDVFVKPFIGALQSLNMMPVYRIRDGYDKLSKNEEVFAKCERLLQQGSPVLIFPEGNMAAGHYLRPLTKGVARMALQSQEKLDDDLMIIPVGINYFHHYRPRHRCVINFGAPLKVRDYMTLYEQQKAKALIRLKDDLSRGMKDLLLIPDTEGYERKRLALNRVNEGKSFEMLKEEIANDNFAIASSYPVLKYLAGALNVLNPFQILAIRYILKNVVKDRQFATSLKYTLGIILTLIWWIILGSLITLLANWQWAVLGICISAAGLILRAELKNQHYPSNSAMNLISLNSASFQRNGKTIIHKIDLNIREGNHSFICGENGSGKSTLCLALAGRLHTTAGRRQMNQLTYRDIAFVSFTDTGKLFHSVNNTHYYQQRFNAWDADGHLTVQDYLHANAIDTTSVYAKEVFAQLGLSSLIEKERIKLSSGETRKMLLASAILKRPKILILDNAYIGLDAVSRSELNLFLDEFANQFSSTLVISGHATNLPVCIQSIIKMRAGKIEKITKRETNASLKTDGDPLDLSKTYETVASTKAGNCLSFSKVNIAYKGAHVLQDFNWQVDMGNQWAVMGNNGSGKSTLVSLIYADHPQLYSQDIRIFNQRPGNGISIWDIKSRIGFTSPELHAYIHSQLTVQEVILTGLFDKLELIQKADIEAVKRSEMLISYFNFGKLARIPFDQISTGQQRLCLLIRALIKHPDLLLLDEPFQAIDEENIQRAKAFLETETRDHQSLIFISHFKLEIPKSVKYILEL